MDTKKLRQKILDLAIRGKLVPQDPNDEPASVLLERIKAEKERLIKEGKIKKSKKSAKTSDTPHYENVPFEIPNSWVWTTLGSVCNFENGFAFSSDDYKQTGVPLIRISNISDNTIDLNGCVFIQKEIDDRFVVEKGDLLIALSGATTGKMGVYSTDKVAYLNQRVGNLRIIDTSVLCHEYRNIFINSRTEAILKLAYGGAQPNISGSVICSFSFPLPPLAEQLRIATEVNHWFALIDQIEQGKADLQETIKQTKSKILDLAIHGKLVPQDPNDEPAIELLKRINLDYTPCDNGHYENLPSGWAMCKLSDLCRIENGFAFSSNDYKTQGIPLVRISNIIHNTIDTTDCAYIEDVTDNKFKISKGDLLIAMSGATTGKMGVYPFDETAYLNQRVGNIKILNKSLLSPDYRNTYMQSKVDEILKIAYGGAQPNISASVIGNFDFPLPPYKEQIRIVKTVQRIFGQLDVITESL
jgi:hypothetical protein